MKKLHCRNRTELAAVLASGALAGCAVHMTILHDDACTPSRCVCEPEFILEDLTTETLLAGARGQAEWIRSTAS